MLYKLCQSSFSRANQSRPNRLGPLPYTTNKGNCSTWPIWHTLTCTSPFTLISSPVYVHSITRECCTPESVECVFTYDWQGCPRIYFHLQVLVNWDSLAGACNACLGDCTSCIQILLWILCCLNSWLLHALVMWPFLWHLKRYAPLNWQVLSSTSMTRRWCLM